jgi:major membrane immunogen (membrane-anchored lipoprotein)
MRTKKSFVLLVGLVVSSLMLAACGGGQSGFPTGKFIKEGTQEYGLQFNEDGTFSVFNGSQTFVTGTYKVEGNVFTETGNTGGCEPNVDFNYTFDGSKLTFTYVGNPEDDRTCGGRYADFNNVTYVLQK